MALAPGTFAGLVCPAREKRRDAAVLVNEIAYIASFDKMGCATPKRVLCFAHKERSNHI
jgi:hypothetical protein